MAKTVSFVSHLELSLDGGKVLPHALCFGDVNNDGGNELVVGTTEGYLYVFRGYNNVPWCKISDLGLITCVTVGNILASESNFVLVFNAEGTCYVYDFAPLMSQSVGNETLKMPVNVQEKEITEKYKLAHKQLLQTNTKMIILGDVDNDGQEEIILCHTDRNVSACRWDKSREKFIILQEWNLHQAVGSITLHRKFGDGFSQIIASQPGCAYATLLPSWGDSLSVEKNSNVSEEDKTYHPMSSLSRSQNPTISCQIVGDICKTTNCREGYFALCTLDGNIKLMEDDRILWALQVDHQLFAIHKLDVLGDGQEEVVLCAWDGFTYIVDHDKNFVRYQYEDNVQAFSAGQYAIEDGENVVCFVYANFQNKLSLYYDIQLTSLKTLDFLNEVAMDREISKLFMEIGAETEEEKRSLIKYCMYGVPNEPSDDEAVLSQEKLELFKQKSNNG